MKELIVHGGRALEGIIKISGSKNAALPCLAASILTNESVTLKNVPLITDVKWMADILHAINVKVNMHISNRTITVSSSSSSLDFEIPAHLSKLMRGSIIFLGSLLARCGRVRIYGYGGCPIGKRPIDLHLKVFRLLGAKVIETTSFIELSADKLKGANIHLDFPSVGATENAIITACLAEGQTNLTNVAVEPEIVDLIKMLKSMGANIDFNITKRKIKIVGCRELGGTKHELIPDRIEAGTYAVAAAITGGDLLLQGVNVEHLKEIIKKLAEMGVNLEIISRQSLRILPSEECLKATEIVTKPYPGFPTDMQPQFTSLATKAFGTSHILENIYENRFHHIPELKKMGAEVSLFGRKVAIKGPVHLYGAEVKAKDIRGGAALVLAALRAEGMTRIRYARHIDRGYENLEEKLRKVGGRIEVINNVR